MTETAQIDTQTLTNSEAYYIRSRHTVEANAPGTSIVQSPRLVSIVRVSSVEYGNISVHSLSKFRKRSSPKNQAAAAERIHAAEEATRAPAKALLEELVRLDRVKIETCQKARQTSKETKGTAVFDGYITSGTRITCTSHRRTGPRWRHGPTKVLVVKNIAPTSTET